METLLAIRTRRSIRSFTKKPVSKKKIEKIIEAGLNAPSSKNSNPWYFVAVDGEKKDKIADVLDNILKTEPGTDTAPVDPKTGKIIKGIKDTTDSSIKIIREAAFLILTYNRSPFAGGYNVVLESAKNLRAAISSYEIEALGIGAAMENMLLAAHDLGLGAVFLRDVFPAMEKIKNMFQINYDLTGAVAVGYPAYHSSPRELRKDLFKFV